MRQGNSKHDERVMTCMLIEFFSREYAARKFLQDSMKGEFELCQWNDNYWSLVRYIVLNKLSCADTLVFKGKTMKVIDFVHSSEIYRIYREYQKEISYFINLAILVHHNSLTDNPKNKLAVHVDLCEYKQYVSDILVSCRDEIIFLHSICVNYGYYPADLTEHRGASELIEMFKDDKVPSVNPFVRTTQLNECSDVRINYATSDGMSFFEDEVPGLFYFYTDINEGGFKWQVQHPYG